MIDALCGGILLALWRLPAPGLPGGDFIFLLYNLLAFGTQPLFGLLVDQSGQRRGAALAGSALVAMAALGFNRWPLAAITAAGLGNALFHLGAGSLCLQLTPGRAAAPGLFVAPGAVGLFVGMQLGQAGKFAAGPFLLALAGLGLALTRMPLPAAPQTSKAPARDWPWQGTALVLLLACIGVRSLAGFALELPWKPVLALGITMTVTVALGKALGGVLADRWGWGRIAVGGLLLATPLLAFGAHSPWAAIPGLLLINLTTAVTLAAAANLLPGRPAFAFGLTCLALELGAWLVLPPGAERGVFGEAWMLFGVMLGAALALYAALRTGFRRLPHLFANVHE